MVKVDEVAARGEGTAAHGAPPGDERSPGEAPARRHRPAALRRTEPDTARVFPPLPGEVTPDPRASGRAEVAPDPRASSRAEVAPTSDAAGAAHHVSTTASGFDGARGTSSVRRPSLEGDRPVGAATGAQAPSKGLTAEEFQTRLGARLRAVRRDRELRLQDVEIRSRGRFKAVVVGSYERGDRAVSASKLAALASFYGVPVADLLPDDDWPRGGARETSLAIAVDRVGNEPELAPLRRLVQHVQWLRGDYNGRVLSLRGDDLRTVAIALGVDPDALADWLEDRDLLV